MKSSRGPGARVKRAEAQVVAVRAIAAEKMEDVIRLRRRLSVWILIAAVEALLLAGGVGALALLEWGKG